MLRVVGEHKYLLEYITEDENTITGKLMSQCPNHRYKRNIPDGYIVIFDKSYHQHKPFIFTYKNVKYFKQHENAIVAYDDLLK